MKKNLLITGANGFVGSSFINSLKEKYEIYGIFKEKPQINQNITKEIIIDLSKEITKTLPKNIDTVIHFAQSNYYRDQDNFASDIVNINILSTLNLLEWAKKTNVKKFIFTSTGNVYMPANILLDEESCIKPNSLYGSSKVSAEMIIEQYKKYFDINILRLFSVYGPGQTTMLIPDITKKIQSKEKIFLAQLKGIILTPIYIQDAINIIEKIIDEEIHQNYYEIYNMAGKEKISLHQIVLIIAENLNIKPIIESTNNSISYLTGSGDKLINKFNIEHMTSMKTGLTNFIKSINDI
jgi:UDP-glucose 4-epimerase